MRVLVIEPYYTGSHKAWVDGYARHSSHEISTLTLPGQNWKWRMDGGAVSLARMYLETGQQPDLILASDMMNLATFRALTRSASAQIPIAFYFHENQLSYPQNHRQHHGRRFGFVIFISALSADAIFFNSAFHKSNFFAELRRMLKNPRDYNELETLDMLHERSKVLPLGLDLRRFDAYRQARPTDDAPIILWNHRWEADKNPRAFVEAITRIYKKGIPFKLVIAGENTHHAPTEFEVLRYRLRDRILHYGYLAGFAEYARWLWRSSVVVSTSYQDFFGISVAEGIYCGAVPVLPRRLNYPDLLPKRLHDACLYDPGGLQEKLEKILLHGAPSGIETGVEHIRQFDWFAMARRYDETLAGIRPLQS